LTSDADQDELSGDDLRTGELFFGLPIALVILLLVFGAVVAGLVAADPGDRLDRRRTRPGRAARPGL
jgi:hypothetical protein